MSQGEPLTVSLVSLGCPKNLVDSERMLGRLAEGGCVVGAPMADADVIIVNTCGFLSAARDESLEVISEALECKRTGRARRVVVAGCLVQRDAEKLFEMAPGIDSIVGVHGRDDILLAVATERRAIISPGPRGVCSDAGRFRLTPRHTAYLRISEGCSHRCSFCAIPDIRGPLRSKSPQVVVNEARELIGDGAVELNVIGQDTTAYGSDLAGLLRDLDALDGVRWIRLLYTYPRGFSDDIVAAMGECQHMVRYVDVPLQHISDDVLGRMRRGIKRKGIEKLLDKLRRAGMTVRTTFIVGFPGETDGDFGQLLSFVKEFRFDAMGVFEYSLEPGTPAADMPDQVPADVKAARAEAIMTAQQEIAFGANEAMVGRSMEVLADGVDTQGRCVGRHAGQAPDIDGVCYLTAPRASGTFVSGTVADWDGYDLIVRPR